MKPILSKLRNINEFRNLVPNGTVLLLGLSIVAALMAFVREAVIAYYFGASKELDAFLVGLALPQIVAVLSGMISVSVILPVYVKLEKQNDIKGYCTLMSTWSKALLLFVITLDLLCLVAPDAIVSLFGPGLSENSKETAANWLLLLLPYMTLMVMVGPLRVVLESRSLFLLPASAGVIISLSMIATCGSVAEGLGIGSLVLGYTIGALLVFIVQKWKTKTWHPVSFVKKQHKMSMPWAASISMLVVAFTGQMAPLIDRAFASTLGDGSVSVYNYAVVLLTAPVSLLSSAIATALFPKISGYIANNEMRRSIHLVYFWIMILVALMLVISLLIIINREDIVRLVFGRGKFDDVAIALTSSVLAVLPLLLLPNAVSILVSKQLLASSSATILAKIAVMATAIKIPLTWWLCHHYGLVGIAWASVVIAFIATSTILGYVHFENYLGVVERT